MIVAEIVARLAARAPHTFGLIEGAAELAVLGNAQPAALPAAYVFIAEEAAGENELITGVLQRVETDVSVVVITANLSDATGAAASDDIDTLKRTVRRALVGWQPSSAEDVITLVGARTVRVREGAVWVEMTFATATYENGEG